MTERTRKRKTIWTNELNFLLFCLFISIFTFHVYAGDGQIDILPNGSEPFVISRRGSYILTAGEVTLDLNGHTITGTGTNSYGINGTNAGGVTIRNGRIQSFGKYGIILHILGHVENVSY